jgi:hypothetical protein
MHDAEDQHDLLFVEDVVHDPVVTHTQSVERVADTVDGLDGLAADAAGFRGIGGELLEGRPDPLLEVRGELLERTNSRRRQLDVVRCQSRSSRLVDRPLA